MHDLDDLERRARHLMDALGRAHLGVPLQERGWGFGFDRARRRLGRCAYRREQDGRLDGKRITLSRHHALQSGWALMEDVVRHEIAHALDVETRGRSDHGPSWRRWARRCGADPRRLYEGALPDDASSKYVAECPRCRKQTPMYRRPSRRKACSACCRRHSGGRFDARFELVIRERARTGPPRSRSRR